MAVQVWHLKQRLIGRAVEVEHLEFVQRALFAGPLGCFLLA